jgi:hypothetical protein
MYTAVSARLGDIWQGIHLLLLSYLHGYMHAVRLHLKLHVTDMSCHTHRHAEQRQFFLASPRPCAHNARSLISQCHPRPSRRQQRHLAVSHPSLGCAKPLMRFRRRCVRAAESRYGGRAGPAVRSRCTRRWRRQRRFGDGS